MEIFIYVVKTESCDQYVFTFKNPRNNNQIIELVMDHEGLDDYNYYKNTLSIQMYKEELKD